jgi:hypothetical protein
MATRGTYKIDGLSKIMYNHWDNYPSGTAFHLLEVAKKFHSFDWISVIRGMENMNETSSKFDGPAEYYYEISKSYVKCYQISYDDNLILHSEGKIHEWINKNIQSNNAFKEIGNPSDYTLIEKHKDNFWTITQIQEEIEERVKYALNAQNNGWTGNASSAWHEALKMITQIPSYPRGEMIREEWINRLAQFYADKYKHETPKYFLSYAQ